MEGPEKLRRERRHCVRLDKEHEDAVSTARSGPT